jgi:hypothetical protein
MATVVILVILLVVILGAVAIAAHGRGIWG